MGMPEPKRNSNNKMYEKNGAQAKEQQSYIVSIPHKCKRDAI